MVKLNELSTLRIILSDSLNDLELKFNNQIKKIKLEYNKLIIDEKIKLLEAISNDEKLDLNKLKQKYLKTKDLKLISNELIDENNEEVLDKITQNNVDYYYNRINKNVYDSESNLIGILNNNEIEFI